MSRSRNTISRHDWKTLRRYNCVRLVPTDEIKPSPENEEIYGPINEETDPALQMLMRSIERIGLEEPIIATKDKFVLSGHRRYFALRQLGFKKIPVRFVNFTRWEQMADYHRLLAQYNPQRVKSVASVLSEALLNSEDDDGEEAWEKYQSKRGNRKVETLESKNSKGVRDVGPRMKEFLTATQKVIAELSDYWPLSIRQIHYRLLNNAPLTQLTKRRNERWRYRNDKQCYQKLSNLLVSARYHGHVAWESIEDVTRKTYTRPAFDNVTEFINGEVEDFLVGYHRDRQEGQPHYIEVLVEKNTLVGIVKDICQKLYVPLTSLRGYGGPSVWHALEMRWREKLKKHTGKGKCKCTIIILSDHDPEGLDLADDALRSLRDLHGVDVRVMRPLLSLSQTRRYRLPSNPIKEKSKRRAAYHRRTGLNESWECEALDPEVTRQVLHDALLSVMDVKQLNAVQEREAEEKSQLSKLREKLGNKLQEIISQEGL